MQKFYFTYGTEGHPFYGGWTEIVAPNEQVAVALFRALHPDTTPGILNCAWVYPEDTFAKTSMAGPNGNFRRFCHEKITVSYELTQE